MLHRRRGHARLEQAMSVVKAACAVTGFGLGRELEIRQEQTGRHCFRSTACANVMATWSCSTRCHPAGPKYMTFAALSWRRRRRPGSLLLCCHCDSHSLLGPCRSALQHWHLVRSTKVSGSTLRLRKCPGGRDLSQQIFFVHVHIMSSIDAPFLCALL